MERDGARKMTVTTEEKKLDKTYSEPWFCGYCEGYVFRSTRPDFDLFLKMFGKLNRREIEALRHFKDCPYDSCERCIGGASLIVRIREKLEQ